MDSINTNVNMNTVNTPARKTPAPKGEVENKINDGFVKQQATEKTPDLSKVKKSFKHSETWNTIKFVGAVAALAGVAGVLGAGVGAGLALMVGGSVAKGAAIFGGASAVALPVATPFIIGKMLSVK